MFVGAQGFEVAYNRGERKFDLRPGSEIGLKLAAGSALLVMLVSTVFAQESGQPPEPVVEDLGGGRYRIGSIEVDRPGRSFSVPGRIIELSQEEMPLEFLVIARGGPKDYESLLEMDADAFEFNLACILLGLDQKNAVLPRGRFDPEPADGDPVELWVSWEADGAVVRKPVGALLQISTGEDVVEDWVYTGSFFFQDGRYAAQLIGLLVGFVHDPESIIQHRGGLGLSHYGAVTYRRSAGPPSGHPIRLTVERPGG